MPNCDAPAPFARQWRSVSAPRLLLADKVNVAIVVKHCFYCLLEHVEHLFFTVFVCILCGSIMFVFVCAQVALRSSEHQAECILRPSRD